MRHLLGPLSMFGPVAGTSWTHYMASPNSPNRGFNLPPAAHPPPPPLPPTHPPILATGDIAVVVNKRCSKSGSVS